MQLDIWDLSKIRALESSDDIFLKLTAGLILVMSGHDKDYSFTFEGDQYSLEIIKHAGASITIYKNNKPLISQRSDKEADKEIFSEFFKWLETNFDQ